jgi:predicted SprT family Zn-dependent metalloprotease
MTITQDMKERAWLLQLVQEFKEIVQYYGVALPQPFIKINDSQTEFGSWNPYARTLSMSRHLIENHGWDVVLEIFKHELAHLWVSERGRSLPDEPHGPAFQEACRRLGVAPWARQAIVEIDPATARSQHRHLSEERERQVRRIEKLLALARSCNPNEAALAMERARALSVEYQIERQNEGRSYTYILINHQKKVMPAHQSAIASLLCSHFYVDCVSRSQYDAGSRESYKILEILGTVENVAIAEYVYWYLWRELPYLWKTYAATQGKTRASQRSFYLGVLNGFHDKLDREKRSAEMIGEAGDSGLIALDKGLERILRSELRGFVAERFPRLNRNGSSRSGLEAEAYRSGVARGRNLELKQGLSEAKNEGPLFLSS